MKGKFITSGRNVFFLDFPSVTTLPSEAMKARNVERAKELKAEFNTVAAAAWLPKF